MELRFLGRETTGGQSPTLYATDQGSYVVQGWIVTDADILAMLDLAEDETLVEVYAQLMTHLAKDGLAARLPAKFTPSSTSGRIGGTFCGASWLPTRKLWRR